MRCWLRTPQALKCHSFNVSRSPFVSVSQYDMACDVDGPRAGKYVYTDEGKQNLMTAFYINLY